MGQVSITVGNRTYRLACGDGEEDRLVELATFVKAKLDQLAAEFGPAGDERLMLMAALLIADELWDARALARAAANASDRPLGNEPEPVRRLRKVAAKVVAPAAASTEPNAVDAAQQPADPPRLSRDGAG